MPEYIKSQRLIKAVTRFVNDKNISEIAKIIGKKKENEKDYVIRYAYAASGKKLEQAYLKLDESIEEAIKIIIPNHTGRKPVNKIFADVQKIYGQVDLTIDDLADLIQKEAKSLKSNDVKKTLNILLLISQMIIKQNLVDDFNSRWHKFLKNDNRAIEAD